MTGKGKACVEQSRSGGRAEGERARECLERLERLARSERQRVGKAQVWPAFPANSPLGRPRDQREPLLPSACIFACHSATHHTEPVPSDQHVMRLLCVQSWCLMFCLGCADSSFLALLLLLYLIHYGRYLHPRTDGKTCSALSPKGTLSVRHPG